MRFKLSAVALLLLAFSFSFSTDARANHSAARLKSLAAEAVSEDAGARDAAIAELRAAGPAGHDALFDAHAEEIARQLSAAASPGGRAQDASWLRLADALDRVSRQRDSYAARLYWHTDIEEAKRAARAEGKPILSLRLLGDLGEELSCANSRFFRTALYANAAVSRLMRERFVLHWKSVRPAPRLTVDFGDGRRIETTVTGNSIHYVLDSEGWPVDALPGLYGPAAFARELERAGEAARGSMKLAGERQTQFLAAYYDTRARELITNLRDDAARAGVPVPADALVGASYVPPQGTTVSAVRAMPAAMTKRAVEAPAVRALVYDPVAFAAATGEASWSKLAALHAADARLDGASLALIARHNSYGGAGAAASPNAKQLARVVRNFETNMALDTVRNEYLLRPRLIRWFIEGANRVEIERLNERVYAELFLTPGSDPWLGLLAPDTYTGVGNGGVRHMR